MLFFLAAGLWFLAGAMLFYRGFRLVAGGVLLPAAGLCGGLVFFRLVFMRISSLHISRIRAIPHARPCLFSFLDWRAYGLMVVMVTSGILIRASGFFPLPLLGTFFITMGTPLMVSSLRFATAGFSDPR